MKKLLLIALLLSFASCKGWNEDEQQSWHTACMEQARTWAPTDADAKTYCDCVMQKLQSRYPDLNEALKNVEQIAADTLFVNCRSGIKPTK